MKKVAFISMILTLVVGFQLAAVEPVQPGDTEKNILWVTHMVDGVEAPVMVTDEDDISYAVAMMEKGKNANRLYYMGSDGVKWITDNGAKTQLASKSQKDLTLQYVDPVTGQLKDLHNGYSSRTEAAKYAKNSEEKTVTVCCFGRRWFWGGFRTACWQPFWGACNWGFNTWCQPWFSVGWNTCQRFVIF